ncbi:efflux RND transporter periplasmic adaptor subunit [Hydrogenophaga pseudoflava]|uniref:efflux RND transporter periplasmic adaptor subunit n=1 Tax=Hydrogenophaga pseudoflava TaxID=47421 RepID=UPI0027E47736|nr:biotin/lipoyl-binding protein [Hydrogenophaga pseudoflava]MDQ7743392.1 biotin/lipoyl-binding protein [Hydrogenophaga pseudoflava]
MSDASDLGVLLQIEARALEAETVAALRFTIVNETHALTPYRQAAMFELEGERLRLVAASGLVSVANDSPFAVWLSGFAQRLPRDGAIHRLDIADASPDDAEGWGEWLPEHLALVPLRDRRGAFKGMVLYAAEQPWSDRACELLGRLHATYGYCLAGMRQTSQDRWRWLRPMAKKRNRWILAGLLVLSLFVPVRLSVLAPAEVVALNAIAVAAPQDGVVGSFAVAPNAKVKAGDLLFSLDDSSLLNRLAVARKALEIAQADAHIAQQRAFDDLKSKADVAVALGRVREKEAELAAVETQAQRVEVRADRDGIAIFSDTNDWIGRPVMTGERVMQLAQPEDGGIQVWLAVADAINLELDAPVRLFLHTDPLSPRSGRLVEASYQATLSPDSVASYKLRAKFDEGTELPRIGLRGTARISGDWVLLGYYLFRRPLAHLREWSGL